MRNIILVKIGNFRKDPCRKGLRQGSFDALRQAPYPLRGAGSAHCQRMGVRLISAGQERKMGDFTEKKFLHFMGGYGILRGVVEENGASLL